MYAVVGRVKIKPGHEEETRAMIVEGGVPMVRGRPGSAGGSGRGIWTANSSSTRSGSSTVDTEENARTAEATFNRLREMPDTPATFVSVDVCELLGQA